MPTDTVAVISAMEYYPQLRSLPRNLVTVIDQTYHNVRAAESSEDLTHVDDILCAIKTAMVGKSFNLCKALQHWHVYGTLAHHSHIAPSNICRHCLARGSNEAGRACHQYRSDELTGGCPGKTLPAP